ncbi:hypothetical protein ACK36G_18975 [Aeromonas veronii]|uniref:hypothetical protein n=1 Tax=Aeromonas veronii TaxID=654 RepID=UPI0038E79C06
MSEKEILALDTPDERVLATLSPANLKTKEDGSIYQKNGPRLRIYLDAFLLQAAGYAPDAKLSLKKATRGDRLIAVRFAIGSSGLSLSPIVRSGKCEVPVPGSALRFDMPPFRRVRCWFRIDTARDTLTVAIPFGTEGC